MEAIEVKHNSVLTEVFRSETAYNKHNAEVTEYSEAYNRLTAELVKQCEIVRGKFGTFCPELQYVHLDMLECKDWPHGIAMNSVYIEFKIDFKLKQIEVGNFGHIELTDADKKKSYLCMCSVKAANAAAGGKWWRKCKYKSIEEAAQKMAKFYKQVCANIQQVTGGYPYKQMKVNIY